MTDPQGGAYVISSFPMQPSYPPPYYSSPPPSPYLQQPSPSYQYEYQRCGPRRLRLRLYGGVNAGGPLWSRPPAEGPSGKRKVEPQQGRNGQTNERKEKQNDDDVPNPHDRPLLNACLNLK